jgi:hypothetical protein
MDSELRAWTGGEMKYAARTAAAMMRKEVDIRGS